VDKDSLITETPGLKEVLGNIEAARAYVEKNESVKIVVVVSGSEADTVNFKDRLDKVKCRIFNRDGSTLVLSFQEKIGKKTREGNFLGTLLAYHSLKKAAQEAGIKYRDLVTLVGMVFGRGERMSPITQANRCSKPSIRVTPANVELKGKRIAFTAIEEALMYFTPVAKYLERRGFRGILDKWGDETEIPSRDLTEEPEDAASMREYDVIKIISVLEITEELAKQKEWAVFDDDDNMLAQLSRGRKDTLIEQLKQMGIKPREDGKYYAGVSLGPVAVSYDVLDIASEVFSDEIVKEDIFLDFDPFFLMALAMKDASAWDAALEVNEGMKKLIGIIPDFFEKVQEIKNIFRKKYGRELNLKVLDLGGDVYWADIGQHGAMRDKFLSFNDKGARGITARKIAGIDGERDGRGNIIVNSEISSNVTVSDSVIVNSRITGTGKITGSVIIDSQLADIEMTEAFAVRSARLGKTVLKQKSGLFESLGADDITLEEGMRHVAVLTSKGKVDMRVSEETDLRDKDNTYNVPIFGNDISFEDAYNEMFGVSSEELEKRRRETWKTLKG